METRFRQNKTLGEIEKSLMLNFPTVFFHFLGILQKSKTSEGNWNRLKTG